MSDFYYETRRVMDMLADIQAEYEHDKEEEKAAEVQAALEGLKKAYRAIRALKGKDII